MKTDIEIARETKLNKIEDIAEKLGVPRDEVQNYGRYIAKVPIHLIDKKEMDKHNLILVSAITPNKAGVGKTTVSIGLSLGLNKIGKKAVVALREPSLGPCFGMKGGAAGNVKYCSDDCRYEGHLKGQRVRNAARRGKDTTPAVPEKETKTA